MKFYKCEKCGKVIVQLEYSQSRTQCCADVMTELTANADNSAYETHVPVYSWLGSRLIVDIGRRAHPMSDGHHIVFAALEMPRGFLFNKLAPDEAPQVLFEISEDPVALYSYCNQHGLWMMPFYK